MFPSRLRILSVNESLYLPPCLPLNTPPTLQQNHSGLYQPPSNPLCSVQPIPHQKPTTSIREPTDGVLVAKKDFNAPKHDEIDVPNLQVIKALQSLDSKQFVKTQFSWQYYYYTLTDAGIEYLREYLHLPSEIFPATFKKTARPSAPRRAGNNPL